MDDVAHIEFWGGVGVIGSSKILVHDGGYRVLLDLGTDIPRGGDLFSGQVSLPPGQELSARLRVGAAPPVPGIYDPAALEPGDSLGEPDGQAAAFFSHPHLDHVGLAGFIRPDIPVHASPAAVALLGALDLAGERLPGPRGMAAGPASWRPVTAGEPVAVGPMRVERIDVDHDVPGASGYRVTTSDGVLAFTGDIRFHGRAPQRSWAFADAVAGCDVLVTEGTTLSFSDGPARTEADVEGDYAAALAGSEDLLLQSVYPRDTERASALIGLAGAAGRTILWPARVAAFLRAAGVAGAVAMDDAGLRAVRDEPGGYVVQLDPGRLPDLLGLPLGSGTVMLHANGEPLGPFDPRWAAYTSWLAQCGVPLRQIGCSGHASADDLHEMVYRIAPSVVMPIHTASPRRLHPVGRTRRVIVGYGQGYDFSGRLVPA
jgi:ribonuclease J